MLRGETLKNKNTEEEQPQCDLWEESESQKEQAENLKVLTQMFRGHVRGNKVILSKKAVAVVF